MYLSKNLKYLRLKNGLSQEFLADRLGYKSYTTIQKWEMGISEPSLEVLTELSKLYNVSMDNMYSKDLTTEESGKKKKGKTVPLMGTVSAGTPLLARENIEGYITINNNINADFALKVEGDSMKDARIEDGDTVFIRQQDVVENGEIAAVLIEDEVTLKRFYRADHGIILKPENSKYQPLFYNEEEGKNIQILGKAVCFQSKL